jgi:Cu-processing system permease protein
MLKILKYSFFDLLRSRWSIIYFLFYFVSGMVLLYLGNDVSKAIISLMNIIFILDTPDRHRLWDNEFLPFTRIY